MGLVDNFYTEYRINKMIEDSIQVLFINLDIQDPNVKYQAYVDMTDKILSFTEEEHKASVQQIINKLLEVKQAELKNEQQQ